MNRNVYAVIALNLMLMTAAWVYMDLHSNAVSHRSDRLHEILDMTEKNMGTYDSVRAHSQSAYVRAMRVAMDSKVYADRQMAYAESLAHLAEEGTVNDYDLSYDNSGANGEYHEYNADSYPVEYVTEEEYYKDWKNPNDPPEQ